MSLEHSLSKPNEEAIAIIGMACRFPGGVCSPEEFWELLREGRDAISTVPEDRWNPEKFYDSNRDTPGRTHVMQGGFLEQAVDQFDWEFFGISPRQAEQMDPQQRLLLEVVWESLEDACLPPDSLRGSNTGVYMGGFLLDNLVSLLGPLNRRGITTHTATSATMAMLGNRISHVYDFQGPCLTVDTACSSSLLSLHLACQGLKSEDCDLAIAGGVNLLLRPEPFIAMSKGGFLASDGRCKTFDISADGYARGEGAGVLVLKPLSKALQAGDRIHAVVRGTGVNQDGNTAGITLPNSEAQSRLLKRVLNRAGVKPKDIHYAESHGTGTQAGDRAEIASLHAVLSEGREPEERVWVGALKTNIGHLEAAAGVASVIKSVLVTQRRQVPPNLHLQTLNPALKLEETVLQLPHQVERLHSEKRVLACVSGFGYGGSNACVLLSTPPLQTPQTTESPNREATLLPLSASSPPALERLRARLATYLEKAPELSLSDLAYTLSRGRTHLPHRVLFRCRSQRELLEQLQSLRTAPSHLTTSSHGPVFLYTGMGSQWYGMGAELLESEPVFAEAVARCEKVWSEFSSRPLLQPPGQGPMEHPEDAQPSNLALQVALTELWRSQGVEPSAVVGHSVGEVAAAWAAGVLSLRDAFQLCFHRCRLQQSTVSQEAGMMAVGLSGAQTEEWTGRFPQLEIAALNSSKLSVLAGPKQQLDALQNQLEAAGILAKPLRVSVAYHSSFMDPLENDFRESLQDLSFSSPHLPLFSTVLGREVQHEMGTVNYWWNNARQTVLLKDALQALSQAGYLDFVEVGPHPVLSQAVRDAYQNLPEGSFVTGTLRRQEPEKETFHTALQALYTRGQSPNWRALYPSGQKLSLPSYPWEPERLWSETEEALQDRIGRLDHPFLTRCPHSASPRWRGELNGHWHAFLHHHKVTGETIFPAAAYAEIALELSGYQGSQGVVEELQFLSALNPQRSPQLEATLHEDSQRFELHSRSSSGSCSLHSRGLLGREAYRVPSSRDLEALKARLLPGPEPSSFYSSLAEKGLDYGASFQTVRQLSLGAGEVLAELSLEPSTVSSPFHLHPCLLDGAFHALFSLLPQPDSGTFIPVSLERLRLFSRNFSECYAHGRLSGHKARELSADIELLSPRGEVLADVRNLKLRAVSAPASAQTAFPHAYALNWQEVESAPSEVEFGTETWTVLGSPQLATELESLGARASTSLGESPTHLIYSCVESSDPIGLKPSTRLLKLLQNSSSELQTLVVLTENAQQVKGESHSLHPAQATLWGLARVAAQERPQLTLILLDHDRTANWSKRAAKMILSSQGNSELALRGERSFRHKLLPYEKPGLVPAQPEQPFALVSSQVGLFENLEFREQPRPKPGPGEVEVKVEVSAVNFKDVMKALGLLSHEYLDKTYFGRALGMECSGTISALGDGSNRFQLGDRVAVVGRGGIGRFSTVPEYLVVPLPLDFERSVQHLNFIAAYRGLVEVGGLKAGDTVLIHGGSGGVGLAAIELCKLYGAKVIATAGTEKKRAFLREREVPWVSDSRSLSFYDDVLSWTESEGVDLVLNSLSGDFLRKSLQLLKVDGRFIEIGKRDISEARLTSLGAFDRNQSFAAIDIDTMISDNPALFSRLLKKVSGMLQSGELSPLPSRIFPASHSAEALRLVAQSKHIGKVTIGFSEPHLPIRPAPRELDLDPNASYLITGGFGGFGLETANWLAEQGAKTLIILSRSGPTSPEALRFQERFRNKGGQIFAPRVDVSDFQALQQIFREGADSWPPLRGVVHAAAVLEDSLLEDMTEAQLHQVLRVKAGGAWNLHQLTQEYSLDLFLLYSSVSALVGNPGQANYAAANAYLDSLAHYRRALGLPATSLNWGAIGEVGMVARDKKLESYLEKSGLSTMPVALALRGLKWALQQNSSQVALLDMDWTRWFQGRLASPNSLLSELARDHSQGRSDSARREQILQLQGEEQYELALQLLKQTVASIVRIPAEKLTETSSLQQVGFDSLLSAELRNALNIEFSIDFPGLTLQNSSLSELARQLCSQLESAAGPATELDVEDMSEEELDRLLLELGSP